MATRTAVKVSKRYQIAVPAIAREKLNIMSGDRLLVDIQDGMMLLIPEPENYTDRLAGLNHEIWDRADTAKYINEERDSWEESPKG
jgi:AbrB family looped-hinge helix DNA binding protein